MINIHFDSLFNEFDRPKYIKNKYIIHKLTSFRFYCIYYHNNDNIMYTAGLIFAIRVFNGGYMAIGQLKDQGQRTLVPKCCVSEMNKMNTIRSSVLNNATTNGRFQDGDLFSGLVNPG